MLRKEIKYTDYDGMEQTEVCYFNLTKADLLEMELRTPGGFKNKLEEAVEKQDGAAMVDILKQLILDSYGVRSEDGKRFMKNKALSEEFAQTEAFSELFVEIAGDEEKTIAFMTSVLPTMTAEQKQQVDDEVKKRMEVIEAEAAK